MVAATHLHLHPLPQLMRPLGNWCVACVAAACAAVAAAALGQGGQRAGARRQQVLVLDWCLLPLAPDACVHGGGLLSDDARPD